MSGLFGTFNILKRAMGANQYALNTTSHNIANANTEGYSRQRVSMEASQPFGNSSLTSASGPGQLGTGVDISEITRARDIFLDTQIRNELSTLGKYEARDEFLSEIETIFMEPTDTGLSTAMGKMWDAWQELSRGPENSTLRIGVVDSSENLTDMLNHLYYQLDNLDVHSNNLVKSQVFEINQTITEIEALNEQIMAVKIGNHNPNDLMDKQDVLIDKLSGMMNISVDRNRLGDVTITSNGETIVGNGKKELSFIVGEPEFDSATQKTTIKIYEKGDSIGGERDIIIDDDAAGSFYNSIKNDKFIWTTASGVEKADIKDGSIKGYASIYTEINEYKSQLNALARGIAYSVNIVMNDGKPTTDASYIPFFVASEDVDGNGTIDENDINADSIRVNPAIKSDNTKIKTQADPTDTSNNAERALAIAQLRDSRINLNQFLDENLVPDIRNANSIVTHPYYHQYNTGNSMSMRIENDPSGTNLDIFFRDSVAKLGSSAEQASDIVTSQEALLAQLSIRKESVSGVSMDEEMANMIQYQRSYQAAARVVSTIDELLDVVINRMAR